ncbi:MAG: TetR/AcrR family transcriptional regulator [Candidatus Limnocylindria bacterium]
MPRSTPAHAAEVRRRILEGADRAFQVAGFRGASLPAIAAESGVSVGLIYRYFASKEELFLAVCQQKTESQLNELATMLAPIDDPSARLRAAIDFFIRSLVEQGWGAIVIQALAEVDRNPRLRDMLIRLSEQERGFAAMFLREAVARGEAPADLDVESMSLAVAMLLHGAIAHQAERGAAWEPQAVARAITTILEARLRA